MRRAPAVWFLLILSLALGLGALAAARQGLRHLGHRPAPPAAGPGATPAPADGASGAAPPASVQPSAAPPGAGGSPATGDRSAAAVPAPAAGPAAPPGGRLPVAPPAGGTPAPAGTGSPVEPRLLVILIDGLSARDADRLPSVDHLARTGVRYALTPVPPTWPSAAWTAALTGLPPGQAPPAGNGPPPEEPGLLPALRRAGLAVAAVGTPEFLAQVGPWVSVSYPVPPGWEGTGSPLLDAARQALASGTPVVLVHLEGLHTVAHRLSGDAPDRWGAGTVSWAEALSWLDVRLALLLEGIDLNRTAVAVLGTYAAAPGRPHRLAEPVPLVLAGAGVAQAKAAGPDATGDHGANPPAPSRTASLLDAAPTLAALVGAPPFPSAGTPLWGALAPGLRAAAPAWTALHPQPAPPAWGTRLRGLWAAVQPHLPRLAPGLALAAVYLLLVLASPRRGAVLAGCGCYLALAALGFWLHGGPGEVETSIWEFPGGAFWYRRAAEAAGALLASGALVGFWQGRRGSRPGYAVVASLHAGLTAQVLLGLAAAGVALYTGWGPDPRWPGLGWAALFCLATAHAALVGASAPVTAVVAGLVAAAVRAAAAPSGHPPVGPVRAASGRRLAPFRPGRGR